MRIFITGGCGFIGSHIAEYHLAKGDDVHVVDNLSTGTKANIANFIDNPHFKFDEADILTWPGLTNAIKAAERIYHFAAIVGVFNAIADPIGLIKINILGTEHILQTILEAKVKPIIVFAASSSVYGDNPKNLLVETDDLIIKSPQHPLSTYTISKLADEAIAIGYHHKANLPIIITRIFNTIGPRQTGRYGMVVPRFIQQATHNEAFTIFGDGTQTRSFCDVRDVVIALDLLAGQQNAIGEIINVGNDHEFTINQLADLICQCIGRENARRYVSYQEAYGVEFTDVTQRHPDLTKLHTFIKFKHKWTLKQTIQDLIHRAIN